MGHFVLDGCDEHLPAGTQQKQLNTNTLVNEIYLLDVHSRDGRVTRKWVVE